MKKVLLCLLSLALCAAGWGNEIRYQATSKLELSEYNFAPVFSDHSFENGLGIITFDDDLEYIYSFAFFDCSSMSSITIPSSVECIGNDVFDGCSSLTSITIPSNVETIDDNTFYGCSSLTSITIPANVRSIGKNAFEGCSSLSSITIPSSVESIGYGAFSSCSGLTSITVEEGNQYYDSRNDCNAIIDHSTDEDELVAGCQNTIIPNTVVAIGKYAFFGITSLTSITIPSSVKSIGDDAFSFCESLTSITIPASVESFGSYIFASCTALTSVTFQTNIQSIKTGTFYGCTSLTSYTIPSSVTSIENRAFEGCSSLPSITIPSSVESIGYGAFSSCSGLTSITVEEGNQYYDGRNDCNAIIHTSTNELVAGCQNTIIPNTVVAIGESAFYGITSLTSITIPSSVESIGDEAFSFCESLTSITIPASVESFGKFAFSDCALTEITCLAPEPPTCGRSPFGVYPPSISLYVPEGTVAAYQAADGWKKLSTITDQYPATVTLNESGYATFSSSKNVKVSTAGVTAYKAVVAGETITLTALNGNIPAGTGVLLYGTPGTTVSFVISSTVATNLEGNCLQATTTMAQNVVTKPSGTVWALGTGDEFQHYTGDNFISNRAFLVHDSQDPQPAPLRMVFEGGTTFIDNVRQVNGPVKTIENGRLVIEDNGQKYNIAGQKL